MPHRLRLPLALLALTGCGSSTGPAGDLPSILTELPRTLSPSELRIVEGANAFAFDLLREATKALAPDSNAFLSPLSASMALGMTLNGVRAECGLRSDRGRTAGTAVHHEGGSEDVRRGERGRNRGAGAVLFLGVMNVIGD